MKRVWFWLSIPFYICLTLINALLSGVFFLYVLITNKIERAWILWQDRKLSKYEVKKR